MRIDETEVIPFFESLIDENLTIEDIEDFCETDIKITAEEIQAWLNEEAQRNNVDMEDCANKLKYTLNENDLYVYKQSFDIYTEKCYRFCHILRMLAGFGPKSEAVLKQLDIQIVGTRVLKSDVARVIKPLVKNYILACKMKEKAENFETYFEKVYFASNKKALRDFLPDKSIINRRNKPSEESIALTENQIKRWDEEYRKRLKQAAESVVEC